MSISIEKERCTGCGRCLSACPGTLIEKDDDGKAVIPRPQDCWGCTSCLKECAAGAIFYYLGADVGGRGTILHVNKEGSLLHWIFDKQNGEKQKITVDSKNANRY